MNYFYYKQVKSDKHYRFASEIAIDLEEKYNIVTINNKPITRFVSVYLNKKMEESNLERLYFNTKHGVVQVFQDEYDIDKIMKNFALSNNNVYTIIIDKIRYSIYKKQESED